MSESAQKVSRETSGKRVLNENRKNWKYFVFTILTLGIYQLYVLHTLSKDMNEIGEGDGEKTAGLPFYIFMCIITLNIYHLYWSYKLAMRVQKHLPDFGLTLQTFAGMNLGTCWLILTISGSFTVVFIIGIFFIVYAQYLFFENMNALCRAYNRKNAKSSHREVS